MILSYEDMVQLCKYLVLDIDMVSFVLERHLNN